MHGSWVGLDPNVTLAICYCSSELGTLQSIHLGSLIAFFVGLSTQTRDIVIPPE